MYTKFQYQGFTQAPFAPNDVRNFNWLNPFSEPVRTRNIHVSLMPFQPYEETAQFPETVMESKFHYQWSLPVWHKARVEVGDQPFIYNEQLPIVSFGWFEPLSVRNVLKKDGLRSDLQQFLSLPSRILPKPTLLGLWQSQEQYDTMGFTGFASFVGIVARARVSISQVQIPNGTNVGIVGPPSPSTYLGVRGRIS